MARIIAIASMLGVAATASAAPDTNNSYGPHMALRLGSDGQPTGPWPSLKIASGPDIAFALKAAQAAVASCAGFHVGVAILDAAGTPKLYYTPDGTAGVHAYIAHLKANTALKFGMPSEDAANLAKTDQKISATWRLDPDSYSVWAGGVPIRRDNKIVGSIGVSGAEPSAKDKACAEQGLRQAESEANLGGSR